LGLLNPRRDRRLAFAAKPIHDERVVEGGEERSESGPLGLSEEEFVSGLEQRGNREIMALGGLIDLALECLAVDAGCHEVGELIERRFDTRF
jgi:hypothetical protein